jgi:hypothetical protein
MFVGGVGSRCPKKEIVRIPHPLLPVGNPLQLRYTLEVYQALN